MGVSLSTSAPSTPWRPFLLGLADARGSFFRGVILIYFLCPPCHFLMCKKTPFQNMWVFLFPRGCCPSAPARGLFWLFVCHKPPLQRLSALLLRFTLILIAFRPRAPPMKALFGVPHVTFPREW